MPRPRLIVSHPMLPSVVEGLASVGEVLTLADPAVRAALEAGAMPGIAGAAVGGSFRADAGFLSRLPDLQIVANFGVGYDGVDVAHCAARGIVVTNTPDVLTDEVADFTIGLLLATVRCLPQADRFLRAGRWIEGGFPFTASLRDRSFGILGLGRIGGAIARRLEPFGRPIAYHGRRRQPAVPYAFHETVMGLASAVDALIAVAPGGSETRHLINREVLAALGPRGILINVGRGSLVDEGALVEALQDGTIAAAGLDVFEDEPRVPEALMAMEQTVLVPHVASATHHTRGLMGKLVVDNLASWFAGSGPLTPVPETPFREAATFGRRA